MLSSPDARAARASALVWGGSQSVAKPSTIWYPRARVNPINSATSKRRYQ
jgi:hypothetical protein